MSYSNDSYYDHHGGHGRSPPNGDPYAGSSWTAQLLDETFPTSDSAASGTYGAHSDQHSRASQAPFESYEASNYNARYGNGYSAVPVQQHPPHVDYPSYPKVRETRYDIVQAYSSRSTPPVTNTQPPLSVPPQNWQTNTPYYPPSQVDGPMMFASDNRSPDAMYPHATYPQEYDYLIGDPDAVSGTYGAHYQHSSTSQTPYEPSNYNAQYGNTYSAAPVQQHPQQVYYPGYQQVHEKRYGTPPVTNTQPPLSVPLQHWQTSTPYSPQSQVNAQMMSASNIHSPHGMYPHATYPQEDQAMPVGYSGITPALQHGVISTNVPVTNVPVMNSQYPQHSAMVGLVSETSIPLLGSGQPPYARAAPITSTVDYVDPSWKIIDPTKKRKYTRLTAHQLKTLEDVFQDEKYPSWKDREDLAKELEMSAQSVESWFNRKRYRVFMEAGSRQAGAPNGNTSSISQTVPTVPVPAPFPPASGY
ncbi:hypothetical protein FA95DRAFT_1576919 [Auriscalpium vulgare]|uniref:Uncharacterized protein n=1 Tax=Auriscalpium vulgare TaxID=40419 RepID=A0ACB8RAB2_9AGAM|nr:hypothetical protein FA95DRAFT_1576919 [Auriscalpium vulgare]